MAARALISVLIGDHRRLEEPLRQLRAAADADERRRLAEEVTLELVRHSVAEEKYLYPAVRKVLPHGDISAGRRIASHAVIVEILKELETIDAASPEFGALTTELVNEVHQHIVDEDYSVFPWLAQRLNDDEALIQLGKQVQAFFDSAPPVTPGPGLVDRAREQLCGHVSHR
jgi:hemerythrin-like domain-containing protein